MVQYDVLLQQCIHGVGSGEEDVGVSFACGPSFRAPATQQLHAAHAQQSCMGWRASGG